MIAALQLNPIAHVARETKHSYMLLKDDSERLLSPHISCRFFKRELIPALAFFETDIVTHMPGNYQSQLMHANDQ